MKENNSIHNYYKNHNLFEEIRNHNSIINQKLNEIEKNFRENKQKADKDIEDFKNKIKSKDKELLEQKELNKKLVEEKEILNNKISELNKKCKELEDKIKNIKINESKYNDKDFKDLKEIYKGAYGTLFSAYSTKDKIDLCLKKIDINNMENQYKSFGYPENNYLKDLNNEIEILKLLSPYENSVKYYGDYQIIKEKIIVMEKCDEDFENYLKQRNKSLNEEEIKKIFLDLNKIFKVMNENNIIHRDLKLKNFLIKYTNKERTEYIVKLADYGIGKFLNGEKCIFSGMKGTPETVAPEIFLKKTNKYESSVDIFSLGVILYQLSNNLKHPYKSNIYENIILYNEYYDKDNYNIIFDNSIKNDDFKDLIKRMLKLNPKNRISWDDYFCHPFFTKNDNNINADSDSDPYFYEENDSELEEEYGDRY